MGGTCSPDTVSPPCHLRVLVSLTGGNNVTVSLGQELFFSVLLHRVWEKHPTNVDFLGIYIPPTDKFSPKAHGLLGKCG